MEATQLIHLSVKRKRLAPWIDLSGFFVFFGISGVDHGREARIHRRFEQEHYRHQVTVRLSAQLLPGSYVFGGLPQEANRRGWTVQPDGTAVSDLSDEALQALREWMGQGTRTVQPTLFSPDPHGSAARRA